MDEIIIEYLHHLRIEQGLAANTIQSYRRDLTKYSLFLQSKAIASFQEVTKVEVFLFLEVLDKEQLASSSISRMISCLRKFHQYLLVEGIVKINPMEEIKLPKKKQSLPKSLSIDEVDRILATPDTKTVFGVRDRAILEVLYATGLRVSELVHLTLAELHLDLGFIQTIGKGNKERVVPLGEEAVYWVEEYLSFSRPSLSKGRKESPYLFLNFHGQGFIT